MKKQIIFRILILNTLFSIALVASSLSSTEITNMVSEIKKERDGISLSRLESTENPFIIKVPTKKEVTESKEKVLLLSPIEVVYTLKAILNKAAFINKKWYKQGDSIGDYKVGYVSSTSVILKSSGADRRLSLAKKKKKFIKLNRGYR